MNLLARGNFLPLAMHRLKLLAIEVFKSVKKLNPEYVNDLFNVRDIEYDLRDSSKLLQQKFRTIKFGFKSFSYYGSKLWNHIPSEIENTDDLRLFKHNITNWCHTSQARKLIFFF